MLTPDGGPHFGLVFSIDVTSHGGVGPPGSQVAPPPPHFLLLGVGPVPHRTEVAPPFSKLSMFYEKEMGLDIFCRKWGVQPHPATPDPHYWVLPHLHFLVESEVCTGCALFGTNLMLTPEIHQLPSLACCVQACPPQTFVSLLNAWGLVAPAKVV